MLQGCNDREGLFRDSSLNWLMQTMSISVYNLIKVLAEPAILTEMIRTWLEFLFKNQMRASAVKKSVKQV